MLHHPEFNTADVDHNIHDRPTHAVEDGQMDVLDMWQEGDGQQDVQFFEHRVEVILLELLADETAQGLPVLRSQRVQGRHRRPHPRALARGSCKRICLFSNCAVADFHRAVHRRPPPDGKQPKRGGSRSATPTVQQLRPVRDEQDRFLVKASNSAVNRRFIRVNGPSPAPRGRKSIPSTRQDTGQKGRLRAAASRSQ